MFKIFILVGLFIGQSNLSACDEIIQKLHNNFVLSKDIKKKVPFISHDSDLPFGRYLVQNLNYFPINSLKERIELDFNIKLITRGEAHITVITPVEYDNFLAEVGITISEINKIALKYHIQNIKYKILGLGKATKGKDSVYYVLVKSKGLLDIRKEVLELYKQKGGSKVFDPLDYYPHITIGFTNRDLYKSDGIIKGIKTKISDISVL